MKHIKEYFNNSYIAILSRFINDMTNYEEAKQIVNKYDYKIKLIEAKNFNQVLEDLEKI